MSEGEELPPVVASLVGNDESFLEMLARDVEAAKAFSAELQTSLSGAGNVTGAAEGVGAGAGGAEQIAASVMEAEAVVTEAAAEMTVELGAAGRAGGEEFGVGLTVGADEALAEIEASAEAFFGAFEATAREGSTEVGTAIAAGVGAGAKQVETVVETMAEAVDYAFGQMSAGAITAAEAMTWLAGSETEAAAAATSNSRAIGTLRGTWIAAEAAAAQYGTTESQLSITTMDLADAQDQLASANTGLVQAYQSVAAGATLAADVQSNVLQDVADAQSRVTSATLAQIEAQNQLTMAVLQEDTALFDETGALRLLQTAAEASGLSIIDLTDAIGSGTAKTFEAATAAAQDAIQSNLLADAQLKLAAANVTLIDTFTRLGAGEAVSAEEQKAVLASASSARSEVSGLGGAVQDAGKSAENAAGGMGLMANMMYGPLGMAAYGAMMFLPMLSGMFTSNAVSAATFTSAVAQDSNAVGDNTAATIQQTLAKSNLSAISKQLGLSQAQLIEYAAGEKDVQDQVTAAYEAKTKALEGTAKASGGPDAGRLGTAQASQLEQQKKALDEVASAVQQAIGQDQANSDALLAAEKSTKIYNAAVDALGSGMLLNVQNTKMSNQATAEYGSQILAAMQATDYFDAAVGAAGQKMLIQVETTKETNAATADYQAQVLAAESSVSYMADAMAASVATSRESALTSAEASVGLINLSGSQSIFTTQLVSAETAYTEAQQGATAYTTALTAMYGQYGTATAAEAAFTTGVDGLSTSVKSGKDAVDQYTATGAANITAFQGVASAAYTAAGDIYQTTGSASQANTQLQTMATRLDTAATKAGLTKTQVQQLNTELFGVPNVKDISINLDTAPARNNLAEILKQINSSSGTITVYETTSGVVGSTQTTVKAKASGGPVEAGQVYRVNESGAEGFFTPPANGYIIPHEQFAAIGSSVGGGYSSGGGSAGSGGGEAPQVTVHVYLDSREITASVRSESQQYKTRNSMTGFN